MMKTIMGILTAFILLAAGFDARAADTAITGEVMDLACYTAHPDTGQGSSHAKCARECIEKGIPAGILTQEGILYIALGAEHGPANKVLAPHAGKIVRVTGTTREANGVKFIEIASVAEAQR